MSSSLPLRSFLKQKNSSGELNLSSHTNLQSTNLYHCVSYKKDACIKIYEDFCDVSFDTPPGKPIEEVCKVFLSN